MKTKILLIFLLAVSFEKLSAQQPFLKLFDVDSAATGLGCILQNADSSYVVLGGTNTYGAGNQDIYLIKLNQNGDTLWTKTFGTNKNEGGITIAPDTNGAGGYVISGWIYDSIVGSDIVCLVNISADGTLNWVKTYLKNASYGRYIQQTMDGGFLITGEAHTDSSYNYSALIIKTDKKGNPQWQKTLGNGFTNYIANGYCSAQDSLGNFYITGANQGLNSGGDVCVIKLATDGSIIWAKTYGGNNSEQGRFIYATDDGNFLVFGDVFPCSGTNTSGFYLLKITSLGDTLWTKTYHSYFDFLLGTFIMKSNDGGYILSGWAYEQSSSRAILIKIDSVGTPLWSKYYLNEDINPNGIIILGNVLNSSDGGYISCGSYSPSSSEGYGLLIKTDSLGNTGCYQYDLLHSIIHTPTVISDKVFSVTNFYMYDSVSFITGSGGTLGTLCKVVDLPESQQANYNLEVFPNPSSDKITITNSGKSKIDIINVNGQIIKSFYNNEKEMTIDLRDLSNGIYIVKVMTDKDIITKKFIKQ